MTNKTAYLRPLMTENFIFDFPSFFTIKQTSNFTKNDYQDIISDSNSLMKAIMKGTESFWYIETKDSKEIVGSIKLDYTNNEQSKALLDVELSDSLEEREITEIGFRILQLLTENLTIQELTLSSKLNVTVDNILRSYYDLANNKYILKK